MKNLRIAALTIAVALLAVGLTVPFETVLAGSNHHLNFKSFDVDLSGVTLTQTLGINSDGDIVGRYQVGSAGHGLLLSAGTITTIDSPGGMSCTTQAPGTNSHSVAAELATAPGTIVSGRAFRTP